VPRAAAAAAAAGFALVTLALSISALSRGGGVPTSGPAAPPLSVERGDNQRPILGLSAAIGLSAHVAPRLVPADQLSPPPRTAAAAAPLANPLANPFANPFAAPEPPGVCPASLRASACAAAATAQSPRLMSNRSVALARPAFQAAPLEIGLPAPRRKYAPAPRTRPALQPALCPAPQPSFDRECARPNPNPNQVCAP